MNSQPKILFLDIETSPILAYVWGLFDQNVGLNQIHTDWEVLSWAAKWKHEKKVMYADRRNQKNDKQILKSIWKLLNSADIVVGQNSKRFDVKKLNARFAIQGMKPPKPFKQIDTLQLAKKHFAMTSNKLEYLSENLCTRYTKLKHAKFSGFEMWRECLKGNKAAWAEMKKYNIVDVLALEELYNEIAPWGTNIDFNVYTEELKIKCNCGSTQFRKNGFDYTKKKKVQVFQCMSCYTCRNGTVNLLSAEKKKLLGAKK